MSKRIHERLLEKSKNKHKYIYRIFTKNGVVYLKKSNRDLFEYMFNLICSQQLSTKAAKNIWNKVEDLALNKRISLLQLCDPNFYEDIKSCGLSKNKMRAISLLKIAFEKKQISKKMLSKMNEIEMGENIQKLWGFGPWSADMTAMFYFGKSNIWADGDLILNRMIRKISLHEKIEYDLLIKHYEPYKSYLALHMWKANNSEQLFLKNVT